MRLFNRVTLFIWIITPLLALQGCGFHLDKSNAKPLPLCLNGAKAVALEKLLRTKCDKNSYHLEVINSSINQVDITNSMNNSLRQYQLEHFILFNLATEKNKPYRTHVRISINKPLIINNNAILSSNAEREVLNNEMQRDLVQRLTFYLNNQLK